MPVRTLFLGATLLALAGCGVIYTAPKVHDGSAYGGTGYDTAYDVKVVRLTYESAAAANLEHFVPARLPAAFQPGATTAAVQGVRLPAMPAPPSGTARPTSRPGPVADRLPAATDPQPYRIGVSDVLLLSVNQPATLEALPGLISAQAKRQGYVVQDDGAIAIPDVGRVPVANMTLQDAEAQIFQALVAAGIDPAFSLEISEFNSQRVSVGGMVGSPQLVPITLKPLHLYEALEIAGGVSAEDPSVTRIQMFRNGSVYQIGLARFLSDPAVRRIPLRDGDSLYVGSDYREAEAQRYFEEQLQIRGEQLQGTQFQLQIEQLRAQRETMAQQLLAEERALFKDRLELGAVERDYAYRTGEVRQPGRVALPFERSMSLADVLFDDGGADIRFADYGEVYVLRTDPDPQRAGALTAYHLDAENAANFAVATQLQMRPNDVVFVAEQPVTSWNRVLSQILPQLFFNIQRELTRTTGG